MTKGQIYIQNLRLHAFHGVLPQERIVGNDYVVNVTVDYPLDAACKSDDVADTLNYAELAAVIKEEMAVKSQLLEHVVGRIAKAVLQRFAMADAVEIDLRKIAPPMQVDADGAGVRLRVTRV